MHYMNLVATTIKHNTCSRDEETIVLGLGEEEEQEIINSGKCVYTVCVCVCVACV